MNVATDSMPHETKWKTTSKEISRGVVFWLTTPMILALLLAYTYGLAAITFNWVGQDFFWTWYGYLIGWPWHGAWIR